MSKRKIGSITSDLLGIVSERKARGGVDVIGTPTGFPTLDRWLGGLQRDALYLIGGTTGMGKALDVATPIPTPSGWTTMGKLAVGDQVFDENGQPCFVTNVREIFKDAVQYRVTFDDGSHIDACADHLWLTDTRASRVSAGRAEKRELKGPPKHPKFARDQSHLREMATVKTTQEIADTLRTESGHLNHSVRIAAPLQLPEIDLPIHPYVLGAWLGDGTSASGSITSVDQEIIANIEAFGFTTSQYSSDDRVWTIRGLKVLLEDIGVLGDKRIPPVYLRSSDRQRMELLMGLVDTDGHLDANSNCEIVQKNERLAEEIKELVISLGMKATITTKTATIDGRDCGTVYRVRFRPNRQVSRLSRKMEKYFPPHQKVNRRMIVSVEPIPLVDMRCIAVDSPSHLFLAGREMIPTHNSAFALSLALNIAKQGKVVVFYSLEMSSSSIGFRLLSQMTGIAKDRIAHGKLSDREFDQVIAANEKLESIPLLVSDKAHNSTTLVEDAVRYHREVHPIDAVFVDYMGLLTDGGDFGEHERISRVSSRLRNLAREEQLNCPVVALVQLVKAVEQREDKRPTLGDIRDSGSPAQDAHAVIFLYRPQHYERGEPVAVEDDAEIIIRKNREGLVGTMRSLYIPSRTMWTQEQPETPPLELLPPARGPRTQSTVAS